MTIHLSHSKLHSFRMLASSLSVKTRIILSLAKTNLWDNHSNSLLEMDTIAPSMAMLFCKTMLSSSTKYRYAIHTPAVKTNEGKKRVTDHTQHLLTLNY